MPTLRLPGEEWREAEGPGGVHRSDLLTSVRESKEAKIPFPRPGWALG